MIHNFDYSWNICGWVYKDKLIGLILMLNFHIYMCVGTKWLKFAQQASRKWLDRYNSYVDINIPLLIVNYEHLLEPTQLQSTLLRITNQLHVPIKRSVLECLVQTAATSPFKPKPHKPVFQPFDLLPRLDVIKLEQAETRVMARLQEAHLKFRPKVWVCCIKLKRLIYNEVLLETVLPVVAK